MYKNCTKILIEITMIFSICFLFTISSYAKISIIQLTEDNKYYTSWTFNPFKFDTWKPRINDSGKVVWTGYDGNDTEIFFYDGRYTIQLTDNEHWNGYARINNTGEVVWVEINESDWEILFYNGTTITQITDDDYEKRDLEINNRGEMVWSGWDGNDSEIFFYNGTTIIQLTDNDYNDLYPQINNSGEVVWYGGDYNDDDEIFFYNGTVIIQLTDNDYNDRYPQINDSGQMVWVGWSDDWGNLIDDEIFFYDGTTIIQLTDNERDDRYPQINNSGEVVWSGNVRDSKSQIFLYDGTNISRLADKKGSTGSPQINNNGETVWPVGWNNDREISFYDSTDITRLTNNNRVDESPQINNNGEVAWSGKKYNKPRCNRPECTGSYSDYTVFLAIDEYRSMVVIEPNGGETLASGSTYTINWDAPAKAVRFQLQYSTNKGKSWKYIDYVTGLTYDWTVPTPQKNKEKCLVKVTGFDITGNKVGEDESDAPFAIEVIKVGAPNGGEVIASGSTFNVRWNTFATMKPIDYVKVFCSINNGEKWKLMATESGNPGISSCTFPITKKNARACLVKVIAYDAAGNKVAEDASDAPFTIEVVTITSPNGGETLTSGDTYNIEWDTYETKKPIFKILLKYTKNGGKKWLTIGTIKGNNPGAYLWTVPAVPEAMSKCKVMVQLKDNNGNSIGADASNGYFVIEP